MDSISTTSLSRDEWLKLRRTSIGGSDAAAILGMSGRATPFSVWADKTGRLPDQVDNEAMRLGRDLEPYVAKRFSEATEKKVRRLNRILKHSDYAFMHANIDFAIVGERAGLECKTTSALNLKKFRNGEYPANYYAQCVHYLAVTGWERWYLAVLVLGQGFYWYTIERDENEVTALIGAESDFWNRHVLEDKPPPVDGSPVTAQCLNSIYQPDSHECIDLEGLYNDALIIQETQKQIRQLKEVAEISRQRIKVALGESDIGKCGRYEVHWKSYKRSYVSAKALHKFYPKIDLSKVMVCKTFRKFQIKEDLECSL